MRFIQFAEAKKAPKKLLRQARSANVATKKLQTGVASALVRKAKVWEGEGRTGAYAKEKVVAWGEKLNAKRKALASKNRLYLNNKKIDEIVDDFNKAVQAPPNVVNRPKTNAEVFLKDNSNAFKDTATPEQIRASQASRSKAVEKVIRPKGGGKGLLVGAGIAAGTVALGGLGYGLYRKMRSDKGKKRGKYKNFNFPGELIKFGL